MSASISSISSRPADAIRKFLDGVEEARFLQDDLLRSAVLQKLSIIGEAASHLSKGFCERHPEVDWRGIVGFRNIAIHSYFAIEWPIVWVAATKEAPELRERVAAILTDEFLAES